MYETNICDISDLQKCLMQTWFDSEQNVTNAVVDQWHDRRDLVCVYCWWQTLWTHAVKLLFIYTMWFIGTFY